MAAESGERDTQMRQEEALSEREKDPLASALDRCNELIQWYGGQRDRHRLAYQLSHAFAILLSGLTPVLVIWQLSATGDTETLATFLIALFPALAAILTGLSGAFQWREDYIRFAYAAEALKSEKVKFLTRTTRDYGVELSDHQALESFVRRVEKITLQETTAWRTQMEEAMDLGEALKRVNELRDALQAKS